LRQSSQPEKGPIMTRWHLLIALTLALGVGAGIGSTRGETLAGTASDRPAPIRKIAAATPAGASATTPSSPADREAQLALLQKYSPEWWALHDAIDVEADQRLAKSLIICSGCFAPDAADQTGAIK
jgi:hypothetical protein